MGENNVYYLIRITDPRLRVIAFCFCSSTYINIFAFLLVDKFRTPLNSGSLSGGNDYVNACLVTVSTNTFVVACLRDCFYLLT